RLLEALIEHWLGKDVHLRGPELILGIQIFGDMKTISIAISRYLKISQPARSQSRQRGVQDLVDDRRRIVLENDRRKEHIKLGNTGDGVRPVDTEKPDVALAQ